MRGRLWVRVRVDREKERERATTAREQRALSPRLPVYRPTLSYRTQHRTLQAGIQTSSPPTKQICSTALPVAGSHTSDNHRHSAHRSTLQPVDVHPPCAGSEGLSRNHSPRLLKPCNHGSNQQTHPFGGQTLPGHAGHAWLLPHGASHHKCIPPRFFCATERSNNAHAVPPGAGP